jgi:hypothetical protein
LAAFGTAALLVELLRSTAGNCFGRFIGLLPFSARGPRRSVSWTVRDHFLIKTLPEERAIPRLLLIANFWER